MATLNLAFPPLLSGGVDEDNQSHFSDIAFAAAEAMESIDMDNLCSELFTHEFERTMGTPELMSAATTTATATDFSTSEVSHLTIPSTIAVPQKKSVPQCSSPDDAVTCVRCGYSGSDVRVKGCERGCAYHARCIDLLAICGAVNASTSGVVLSREDFCVKKCPHCSSPASGLEILPLSFLELDRARLQLAEEKTGGVFGNGHHKKRTHEASIGGIESGAGGKCYDPTAPRTGRWTNDEIAFRDAIITLFLEGSLPLSNGLKLNDFLPAMLKSKQSRLAKKMKHAKLSTKYFFPKTGHIQDDEKAKEVSKLESRFISTIIDPIERSEIQFHMQREWREHFAERCTHLRILVDADQWLKSVDNIDRRLAFEKDRSRRVRRKFMMGKAMEKDVNESLPGIFIDQQEELEDFDTTVEASVMNSGGSHPSSNGNQDVLKNLPFPGSSYEPNFKHAAPFLAGIVSYIERNSIPFEHADVWVPSCINDAGAFNPLSKGSESSAQSNTRLFFAGSVTVGVQIVADSEPHLSFPAIEAKVNGSTKRVPLTGDEKLNFSLFGDYSEKFSFSNGCGLPGRVFESGIPAWEQFVSSAHPCIFERRGGAMQFGIKTALGLPIESPNVGRIVLVLYSKCNREKDEGLVNRLMMDIKLLNPCPRWKLVVDVGSSNGLTPLASLNLQSSPHVQPSVNSTGFQGASQNPVASTVSNLFKKNKCTQIKELILLLGENIPSDTLSPLGQHLQGIMSLRLVLLRANRTTEEEQLVNTILLLFESYLAAGRTRQDIAIMVARDFTFHLLHQQQLSWMHPQHIQQQVLSPMMSPLIQDQQDQVSDSHCRLSSMERSPSYAYNPSTISIDDF